MKSESILTYLRGMVTARKMMKNPEGFVYSCIEEFVLKNGQEFTPKVKPKRVPAGIIKECYHNAWLLLESSYGGAHKLAYCEGFALTEKLPFPVAHAWCVDQQGCVIDTTWCRPKDSILGTAYFGVAFNTDFVRKTLLSKKYTGVIDNWQQQWPLLRGEEGFKVELELSCKES